jgi:hypothetical protein
MGQPTLDERFRKAYPTRPEDERQKWMTSAEQRFVLWGLKEGWSAARIGRVLGVNEATVRRFRNRFSEDPKVLLQLGLYEMVGRARDDEFRCLVCGDYVIGRRTVEEHIVDHYSGWLNDQPMMPLAGHRALSGRFDLDAGARAAGHRAAGPPQSAESVRISQTTRDSQEEDVLEDLVGRALTRIARRRQEYERLVDEGGAAERRPHQDRELEARTTIQAESGSEESDDQRRQDEL